MRDQIGEDAVKSRVRCATLALGTAQAAVYAWKRGKTRADECLEPEQFQN